MKCTWTAVIFAGIVVSGALAFGQCPPATDLTAYLAPGNSSVWLHFNAPEAGTYRIWSTTNQSLTGHFPDVWTVRDEVTFAAGLCEWTDLNAINAYRRYAVTFVCDAGESAESNEVGYVKITCVGAQGFATYTPFGLPAKFWHVSDSQIPEFGDESRSPSSIVGSQAACNAALLADRIVRQDNGQFSYRNSALGCAWRGSLEDNAGMEPGRAYWYRNGTGATRTLVLAGEADTTCTGLSEMTISATHTGAGTSTPVSWRCMRSIPRNHLNLLARGFVGGVAQTSDRLLTQVGGQAAVFLTDTNTWSGTLTAVSPGQAYWIQNRHIDHVWTYIYDCSGNH